MHALGLLVINDLVGFELSALVVDLYVADGRDALVDVVVIDLARAQQHLVRGVGLVAPRMPWPGGVAGGFGRAGNCTMPRCWALAGCRSKLPSASIAMAKTPIAPRQQGQRATMERVVIDAVTRPPGTRE